MATQTTYFEFNKPAGTDLVNPLVDTNPNWDLADAALHELDERSVANATETVVLGVHAISRLDTYTKFIKWIATANFTAGDTFTVDGNVVAASTPAGVALATGAYVTGSVVLACLNADDSAMTIFVSGTNVATDSERLGGELPSYYATQADMTGAETDIDNLQALAGSTSIASIADGTLTGAVYELNDSLTEKTTQSTTAKIVGTDVNGRPIYEKIFKGTTLNNNTILDASLTNSAVEWFEVTGCFESGNTKTAIPFHNTAADMTQYRVAPFIDGGNGLKALVMNMSVTSYYFVVRYGLSS